MSIQPIRSISSINPISSLTQIPQGNTGASAAQKSGGTQPAGGSGGGGGGGASSVSSTSGSSTLYNVRDLNQDGIVTPMEELLYSLQNPIEEMRNQATVSNSQLQTGLSSYQQSQQSGVASAGSLNSTI